VLDEVQLHFLKYNCTSCFPLTNDPDGYVCYTCPATPGTIQLCCPSSNPSDLCKATGGLACNDRNILQKGTVTGNKDSCSVYQTCGGFDNAGSCQDLTQNTASTDSTKCGS
jgi:hypothetical protein